MLLVQGDTHTAKPQPHASEHEPVIAATSATLPPNPARIVSLAPNLTEIVFALGAGDRLVGVTRFCDTPLEAKALPKIGGFIDPDMEAILAREPDLILGMKSGDAKILTTFKTQNLPYLFLDMPHIDATYKGILAVGRALGREAAATELVAQMRAQVHQAAVTAGARSSTAGAHGPKVLFAIAHAPLIVAGPKTFGHELLQLAGATNLAAPSPTAYPTWDMERVLALDPDVILDATMNPEAPQEAEAFWKAQPSLKAVKTNRVILLQDPMYLRPGPRLGKALKALVDQLYPPKNPAP